MSYFLYENHLGSPTLTWLNVHGVLGVLNVLHTCASCALYAHGRIIGLLGLVHKLKQICTTDLGTFWGRSPLQHTIQVIQVR